MTSSEIVKENLLLYIPIFCIVIIIGIVVSYFETTMIIINLLILFLFILCITPIIVWKKKKREMDIFHPVIFIPLIYFIYFGAGYYLYKIRVNYLHIETVKESSIVIGLIMAIVGIIFFYIGYLFVHKRRKLSANVIIKWKQKKLLMLILFLLPIFILLNLLLWETMQGIPLFLERYYAEMRTEVGQGLGYFMFLTSAILPMTLLILSIYWSFNKKVSIILRISIYTLILTTLTLAVLNVERGQFVFFFIFALICFHYLRKHFSMKKMVIILSIFIFLGVMGGYLRSQQWEEKELVFLNVFLLQLFPEFDNYVKTIELVPDTLNFQMGRTLIPLFTNSIPRKFFPQKDEYKPAGVIFKEAVGHFHIRVGERITLVGELFMNFHIFGVMFGMFVFGIMAKLVQIYLYPTDRNPVKVVLYALTLIGFNGELAGDIVSATLGYIQIILPILIFYAILKLGADMKYLSYSIDYKERR